MSRCSLRSHSPKSSSTLSSNGIQDYTRRNYFSDLATKTSDVSDVNKDSVNSFCGNYSIWLEHMFHGWVATKTHQLDHLRWFKDEPTYPHEPNKLAKDTMFFHDWIAKSKHQLENETSAGRHGVLRILWANYDILQGKPTPRIRETDSKNSLHLGWWIIVVSPNPMILVGL